MILATSSTAICPATSTGSVCRADYNFGTCSIVPNSTTGSSLCPANDNSVSSSSLSTSRPTAFGARCRVSTTARQLRYTLFLITYSSINKFIGDVNQCAHLQNGIYGQRCSRHYFVCTGKHSFYLYFFKIITPEFRPQNLWIHLSEWFCLRSHNCPMWIHRQNPRQV
jgi:hypothetical protein